jgi:exosortase
VLVPTLALLVWATKEDMPAVEGFGFLVALWSSVWLVLGTRFVMAAAFPLGFITCMAPLPGPLLNDATFGVQQMSTHGAVGLLRALLFQPSLNGNIISLDNYTVFVDVPCSGFKLLLSLLTCSAALAYLMDGSPLKRFGLFLISMPLSLAVNIVRLTLLCIVGDCFGAQVGHVFHDWDGFFTLMAGVGVLFAVAKGIGCRTFAGWPLF